MHGRPQLRIVPWHRNPGPRAEARSRTRPPRPADRAADARRQYPDRRLPRRVAQGFRDHLRLLADRALDRLDRLPGPQGRDELLTSSIRSRLTASTSAPARRNPTIVPVRFRDIIRPEHYKQFRWKFFRVHFQFVMANERPHAYDFFMIVCGPVPSGSACATPDAALALAMATGARRLRKRMETARLRPEEPYPPDPTNEPIAPADRWLKNRAIFRSARFARNRCSARRLALAIALV